MTIDAAFTHFPSLTTNRLLLRQIQPQDAEALFATFSDEEAMQFYGHEPHRSLDDTHALIEQIQARYARREAIRWGITLRDIVRELPTNDERSDVECVGARFIAPAGWGGANAAEFATDILKGEDRVIGSCGFYHFDAGFHRAETGYELHRAFWGQGMMTEAMSAILTFGFTELGLHRVEAIIDIANERSKGLLLKLGFTYEGNLRQRYFFRDRFEDEHYFGLLKDEWLGSV